MSVTTHGSRPAESWRGHCSIVPGMTELIRQQEQLAELGADESAVNATPENRAGLAGAMLSFADADVSASGGQVGIDPARVDYVLGKSPSWCFPLGVFLSGAAAIAVLLATAVLAGRVAYGSATLAPPFLSRQPCVLVLAAIPAALGFLAAMNGPRAGAWRSIRAARPGVPRKAP